MHITLCARNCFFTFPYSHSFYVILWSYTLQCRSSAKKTLSCKDFKTQKNDWCDVIHILKLLMHFSQNIALFFELSGVKPIDYVLCVTRHAKSDKTDQIFTYWVYKKTKNVYPFRSFHCKKLYLEDGDISWHEFSLSAFWEYFVSMTRWFPQRHGLFSHFIYTYLRSSSQRSAHFSEILFWWIKISFYL